MLLECSAILFIKICYIKSKLQKRRKLWKIKHCTICLLLLNMSYQKLGFDSTLVKGNIDELKSLYLSDKNQINDLTIFYTPEGKNYFHAGTIVLNFIQIEVDKWLLTTVKEVIEELPATSKKAYNGIVRQEFSEYFNRLIVDYPVNKIIVQNFERSAKNIFISEILSSALTGN